MAALLAGCGSTGYTGKQVDGSSALHAFSLHDQDGRLVSLDALRGRYVVVAFLYTHCTDVCPLIAQHMGDALRMLHNPRVTGIAISVDPVLDTPANARAFLRAHDASFPYLLGSLAELQPVWQEFNVLVERRSAIRVAHDAPVFVLDPAGRPRLLEQSTVSVAALVADVRRLLR